MECRVPELVQDREGLDLVPDSGRRIQRRSLLETLVQRIIFMLTVQGVILILPISGLLGPRMFLLGIAYLFLSSLARLLPRRYGLRVAYVGTYCVAGSGMAFVVSFSGAFIAGM